MWLCGSTSNLLSYYPLRFCRLRPFQLIELGENLGAMVGGIHARVNLSDFAFGIDDKRVPGREFHYAKICK